MLCTERELGIAQCLTSPCEGHIPVQAMCLRYHRRKKWKKIKDISAYHGSSELTCIDTGEVTDVNSCSVLSTSWVSRNASQVHVRTHTCTGHVFAISQRRKERKEKKSTLTFLPWIKHNEFTYRDTDEVTDVNSCSVLSTSWASRNASRVHVRTHTCTGHVFAISQEKKRKKRKETDAYLLTLNKTQWIYLQRYG